VPPEAGRGPAANLRASTPRSSLPMPYTRLGRTGLLMSRTCLGCMTYGVPEPGAQPWNPLRRGRLARPWGELTPRIAAGTFGASLFTHTEANERHVAKELVGIFLGWRPRCACRR
jgi:hypothetical protein